MVFVLLDQENNAVNGPRFDDPSTVAGTEGNKVFCEMGTGSDFPCW